MSSCFALVAGAGCSGGTGSEEPTAPQVPSSPTAPTATEPPDPEELSVGKNVYVLRCVGCHGIDGSGIVGPDIRPGNVLEKYASAESMEALVRDGLGEMPEFGTKLSDDEIAAVVAYVRGGLG